MLREEVIWQQWPVYGLISASGMILRRSLSSVNSKRKAIGEVRLNLELNGVEQMIGVTKGAGFKSAVTNFDAHITVPAGSGVNSKTGHLSSSSCVVALLSETNVRTRRYILLYQQHTPVRAKTSSIDAIISRVI